MAKIKVDASKEHAITLKLTVPELEVIATLISHTRLGREDCYARAATDLCNEIFSSEALYNYVGDLDQLQVSFGAEIEVEDDGKSYVTLNVREKQRDK